MPPARGEKLPAPPDSLPRRKSPRLPPCFLSPSLPPPQRPGALSAPPAARSLPEPARNSAAAKRDDPRRAHERGSQPPFIVAVAPPPLRPSVGGEVGRAPRSAGPPGPSGPPSAPSRPCAQSPESSSPGVAFRLCGPLGAGAAAGPSRWWCAEASSPPRRAGAPPALCCALPPAHHSSTVLRRGRPPRGGGGKGRHRLDGRAIAGAAAGPGGARTLRSGGPEKGGLGRAGLLRFLSRRRRRAVRSIRPEPALIGACGDRRLPHAAVCLEGVSGAR
ncbi:translation initiation factor IF-2-like [Harpia harpyja]|uniref:translation initiation factor IF-2-like n=1 Tax=Harpia harpyja TaxID=202280 RepID=UPI0022B17131|nr:translation initiation factor IF-2-like [Harpia harpyja]XP_052634098.1 translation initiation factor IF-2-like [Harpia harpyja]